MKRKGIVFNVHACVLSRLLLFYTTNGVGRESTRYGETPSPVFNQRDAVVAEVGKRGNTLVAYGVDNLGEREKRESVLLFCVCVLWQEGQSDGRGGGLREIVWG